MNLYTLIVSLHVIVAILGLGPLLALAVLTGRPPASADTPRPIPPPPALRALLRLLRVSQVGLALMLATGIAMMVFVHGAFGRQIWMIASMVLFISLGAGSGISQRYLKRALTPAGSLLDIERAHRLFITMCAVVAVIAWLMKSKPF